MLKRLFSLFMAMLLIASACSCSSREKERQQALEELYADDGFVAQEEEEEEEQTSVIPTTFALPYSAEDTFNPYSCTTTINNTVCDLVFDSLTKVNEDYSVSLSMARSVNIDGATVSVELAPGLLFSDGSAVTVYDIVYSCNIARMETSHFRNQLLSITDVYQDGKKVFFTLKETDSMADRLLDFPIIKRNSDTVYGVNPIGSGRYKFAKDNTGTYLSINANWYGYSSLSIAKIRLLKMPTLESIIYSVEIGTLSFFYSDLSTNNFTNINAVTNLVDLNNLLYLGVNTNNKLLAQPEVRMAISSALDRDGIAIRAYTGRARAATGPYTPKWKEAAQYQTGSDKAQKALAEQNLATVGFVNVDASGIRYNGNGNKLSFSLLINKENPYRVTCAQLIKEQLASLGISVDIVSVDYNTYTSRIQAGNYQLYLAEYPVKSNMDISELINTDSGYYHGAVPYNLTNCIKGWKEGTVTLKETIEIFDRTLPFIPLVYRQGLAVYTRTLKGSLISTESDLFLNLSEWSMGKE